MGMFVCAEIKKRYREHHGKGRCNSKAGIHLGQLVVCTCLAVTTLNDLTVLKIDLRDQRLRGTFAPILHQVHRYKTVRQIKDHLTRYYYSLLGPNNEKTIG